MDTLNDTLKVNVKPPKEEDEDSAYSDEEVADLREQVLTHGRIKWRRNQPKYELWVEAWDEQLWSMWCMIRNFRDDGCFQIMDKAESYQDWCRIVWDNTKY